MGRVGANTRHVRVAVQESEIVKLLVCKSVCGIILSMESVEVRLDDEASRHGRRRLVLKHVACRGNHYAHYN